MSIMGWLTGANDKAAKAANEGLWQGLGYAQGQYNEGRQHLTDQYGAGINTLQGVLNQANTGAGAYGDAMGLNGTEGLNRAYDVFTKTPGYAAGLGMGMDAIDRRAASRGMLGSGNTMLDTMKFSQDYGSQKFGEYIAGLNPYLNQQTTTASNIAGLRGNLGNQLSANRAGLAGIGMGAHTGIGQNNAGAIMANANGMNGLLGMGLNLGTKLMGMV